jgi:hypothetical protein
MRHSRLGKAKNVENFKSEIQIVDTHESLKTLVIIGFAASESQFNRTLLMLEARQSASISDRSKPWKLRSRASARCVNA